MFERSFKDPPDLPPPAPEIPSRDNSSGTGLCCCCSQMQVGASPVAFKANLGLSRGSTQFWGVFSHRAKLSCSLQGGLHPVQRQERRLEWQIPARTGSWVGTVLHKPCRMSFSLSRSVGCGRIASCVFHLGAMSWQTSLLHLFSFTDGFFKVRLWSHRDTIN